MMLDRSTGLLVKPEAARRQMDAEAANQTPGGAATVTGTSSATGGDGSTAAAVGTATPTIMAASRPSRFHGSINLDPTRVGRDAGRIVDEEISRLSGLMNSSVTVTLEVEAEVPGGVPEKVVRTVTENCRTLKFQNQGFEES